MGFHYAPVDGKELRRLADRAHAAGQRELSMRLHDVARLQETHEKRDEGERPCACRRCIG
jgi:hypothetical protein